MIRNYTTADAAQLYRLWESAGVAAGYAPLSPEAFRRALPEHPDFSAELTFVLEAAGQVQGFVAGCTGGHIPGGDVRGYVSCLLLHQDDPRQVRGLLEALEGAFRARGRRFSAVTFFNPIRLPWVLPGTGGHQHDNAPGVATDLPLYDAMLDLGYREAARECAMHLDLSGYETPAWVEEKAAAMARSGDTVARYDPALHPGLEEMLDALGNPLWRSEIPAAARAGQEVLVALRGGVCAGFTGPIYPQATGRGYFAGIGVAPEYTRRGLGTLLFYRLLEREKAAGAAYMSLFTGQDNPAIKIYRDAGFRTVRTFGVLLKEL